MSLELLGAQPVIERTPAVRRQRAWRALTVSLIGAAAGAVLWGKHRVLGALGGGTLVHAAHGVATGDATWAQAGTRVLRQGAAIGGALAVPSHPAAAYVVTNLAAHVVLPDEELSNLLDEARRRRDEAEVIDAETTPRLALPPRRS